MRIFLENNPSKFHPDLIWNGGGGAFGFLKTTVAQQEQDEQDE